jgi:hypothetical protein
MSWNLKLSLFEKGYAVSVFYKRINEGITPSYVTDAPIKVIG